MSRITTDQLRHAVLDRGSFVSWDSEPLAVPVADSYARELAAARAATGADESVQTGEGRVFGRRVAVVACEFDFLGGSIGVAAAERITAAVERATAERLPLLASPSSGGTRMQEGTVAFLQMVKIAAAIQLHNQARLPYLVYLRHPTTGGVFASWGSLGHLTVAEPGALIGFLGPRVYELLYGDPFPSGVQTAENLRRHGIIDGVVALDRLRPMLDRALTVLIDAPEPLPAPQTPAPVPDVPTWDSVVASRRPDRPGVRQLLRHGATDRVLLSGTDQGEAATTLLALARFGGQPTVVLGQQRAVGGGGSTVGPAALREARRGMALAAEPCLPLVLVIDAAGPALSAAAEQGGLAGQIAHCLAELVTLDRVDPAGPGQRRAGAGDVARRPGAGRTPRLAGALASRRSQRDRVPRHCSCRRTRCRPRHPVGRPTEVGDCRHHRAGVPRRRRRADRVRPTTVERHRRRSARVTEDTGPGTPRDSVATLPPDRVAPRLTRAHPASRHRVAQNRRF